MKYKLRIDKKDKFSVEHAENIDITGKNTLKVNGDKHDIDHVVLDDREEIKSIIIDNRYYDIEVLKGKDRVPEAVIVNGQKYPVEMLKVGRERFIVKGGKKEVSGVIKAVIPGKILDIKVREGDSVREGDMLLILEAMKMENEIMAPKDGTVRRIAVENHQNVDKDDVLLVIE